MRPDWLRRLYRLVRPGARNSVAVALLLAQHDRWPRTLERYDEGPVLVLSPHPDDEAIGCGGAVLLHRRDGAAVHVVQVSDGRHGDRRLHAPGLAPAARAALQAELVATRRAEALRWGREAGVAQVHFLEAVDGAIGPHAAAVQALATLLGTLQPRLVYLPFVTDLPEDHWQTSLLFEAAVRACGAALPPPVTRGYEVWTPLPANCVADIGAVAERKQALIGVYASQLRDVDYRPAVDGLNRYRSLMLAATGEGRAEAYFECSLRGWLELMAQMRAGRTVAGAGVAA